MPRGDRTGPEGTGPMSGRPAGYCAGNAVPGYVNIDRKRGSGGRRGRRGNCGFQYRYRNRGAVNPYWPLVPTANQAAIDPVASKEQQLETLKRQTEYIEQTLTELKKQISEAESK